MFRRFIPNTGSSGKGLVQFYGLRAKRSYAAGEKAPGWETDAGIKLHTVEAISIKFR